MITMARIQGSAMGYAGFQKPIVQMGQFTAGPIGAGIEPPAAPPVFFTPPVYPPNYAFLTQEQPVVTPTPTPAAIPTWAIVGMSVVAGAIVAGLVMKNQ
jgi:hypothetical protein